MNELISIIIPVYNSEKYLRECLDSVINQTYKNLEIILVNDGSTDNSGNICDEYANKDKRVVVIHIENDGVVNARNVGLLASKGDTIGFVDADDWIENNMYEYMYDIMITKDVELVQVSTIKEYDSYLYKMEKLKSQKYVNVFDNENCSYKNMYPNNQNSIGINGSLWSKLIKKHILEKFLLPIPKRITRREDLACIYSSIPFIKSIYVSDEGLYHYRKHEGSTEYSTNISHVESLNLFYEYTINHFKNHDNAEFLIKEFDTYFIQDICNVLIKTALPKRLQEQTILYKFPIHLLDDKKNIIIYGMGRMGQSYLRQLKQYETISIVDIVDKSKKGEELMDYIIKSPDDIEKINYDCIIIGTNENLATSITDELINLYDIPLDKIIWAYPERVTGISFLN